MLDPAWTLTHSSTGVGVGVEGDAVGDAVAAADSGSHWELGEAAKAPCVPFKRPKARKPPEIRQIASVRTCADRIRVDLSRLFFPAFFQDTSAAPLRIWIFRNLDVMAMDFSACIIRGTQIPPPCRAKYRGMLL
jgi:hypothetical protein